jgi:uncharacterized protein YggE
MNTRRTLVVAVTVPVLAVGLLTGCSSSSSSDASASAVSISGSPVTTADDITAMCASIVEQKLDPEAAAAMAESSGYTSRVTKLEGEGQAATTDLREDRMNFEVTGGIVTACTVG